MTRRLFEADPEQFALWNAKQVHVAVDLRRTAIAHHDPMIGESLVLLLGLKGMAAQHVRTLAGLKVLIERWEPQVLMIDTRLAVSEDPGFMSELRRHPMRDAMLVLAMSNFLPEDSATVLRAAGYDGHCRRPCAMWQISEVLGAFFSTARRK